MKSPLGICLLAGAAVATLAGMITAICVPAVQVYAEISKQPLFAPASASVAVPPAVSVTPVSLDAKFAGKKRIGVIRGIASWYGGVFNGRKTANGETYDMHELTACQPDLPFGSIVRVVNRRNKRSVVVRINDRGDLVYDDRVIDLSWAAAQKLAMTEQGLAKVDVEILSLGGRGGK
ncbi:MAG: septal ring lytic transglycosylase RlpA family protein [Terracidiphilus sp.]